MLQYFGDITAFELGQMAKDYLMLYAKDGSDAAFVPYYDLKLKKKRFVKFMWLNEQFVYVDLCDVEK